MHEIDVLTDRPSNVFILADETTAAFFAAAGANAIDPGEYDTESLFFFLEQEGCSLLIVSEDLWDSIKKYAEKVTFPPIVLIPSFGGVKKVALDRLRKVSEQALGIALLPAEPGATGGVPSDN